MSRGRGYIKAVNIGVYVDSNIGRNTDVYVASNIHWKRGVSITTNTGRYRRAGRKAVMNPVI
jgi:hypothetical protein